LAFAPHGGFGIWRPITGACQRAQPRFGVHNQQVHGVELCWTIRTLRFPPIHTYIVNSFDRICNAMGGPEVIDCPFALRKGVIVINDYETAARYLWIERN
jgi:hypothetical protein